MVDRVQSSKSVSMVTVACKLPNGMYLQLHEMVDSYEVTTAGRHNFKIARKKGEPIKLAGSALRLGEHSEVPMPGGYSLTQVPADFWVEWCEQNHDSDALKNRILFAAGSQEKAADQAREQRKEGVKSGMEPIDPKAPPRVGAMKVTPAEVS